MTQLTKVLWPVAIFWLLGGTGCSGSALTRSVAQRLISQSTMFNSIVTEVAFHDGGRDTWKAHGGRNNARLAAFFDQDTYAGLHLQTSVKRRVREITGIAAVPLAKEMMEAQFTWEYEGLPPVAKRYVVSHGTGTAIFRLFDDGWRIDGMNLKTNSAVPVFAPSEMAEMQKEVQAEKERLAAAQASKAARAAKLAQLIAQSKQPTRDILVTRVTGGGVKGDGGTPLPLRVNDIGVVGIRYGKEYSMWFGCVQRITPAPATDTWLPSVELLGRFGQGCSYDRYRYYFLTEAAQQEFLASVIAAHSKWLERFGAALQQSGGSR